MSIQNLIDAASPGDTINVASGIYNEQLIINKPLTLQGPPVGEGAATIDATGLATEPTIQVLSDDVIIRRLTIQNGPSHGIKVGDDSSVNLVGVVISNNNITGHSNAGILTNHGASMTISNNTIENNGLGSGFNRGGIILYPHGETDIINNIIVNNNVDGIFARNSDTGLLIKNNVIENYSEAGIMLAWDERSVSIIDNSIKNCGAGNFDEQGGIVIVQSMAELIQGNTMEDCSRYGIFWGWVPSIGDPPSEILISDNRIENSSLDGIYLFSQGPGGWIPPDIFPLEPIIESNLLLNNARAGVYVSNLYYYSPGNANPTIHNNEIRGNLWGVFNATSQIVNATENWWGNNSGPYHPTLNPNGTGDPVSDNVDFIPWLTRETAIEIIKCSISAVSLEKYFVTSLCHGISKLKLVIKVIGNVDVNIDDEIISIAFEKWFSKDLAVEIPESKITDPIITPISVCKAILIGDTINIEINLCITVDIQGEQIISIKALGVCSPRQNFIGCSSQRLTVSKIRDNEEEPHYMECINAKVIFGTCRFEELLFHTINISGIL